MRQAYDYWQDQPGNRETHGERRSSEGIDALTGLSPAKATADPLAGRRRVFDLPGTRSTRSWNVEHSSLPRNTKHLGPADEASVVGNTDDELHQQTPTIPASVSTTRERDLCTRTNNVRHGTPRRVRHNTVHPVRNSPATASRSAPDHSHRPTKTATLAHDFTAMSDVRTMQPGLQ